MTVTVKPYQIAGIDWLASKRHALLADDMGLGKTLQSIKAADAVNAKRVLIICPAIARINWLREFEMYSTLKRDFQVISKREAPCPTRSIICSYDLAAYYGPLFEGPFDVTILDEAHFIKSHDAGRTKAILGKRGVHLESKRIWALTGTPSPNGYASELWPLLFTFGATTLHYQKFVETFCNYYLYKNENCITGTKKHKIAELSAMLAKVMLRRKKEDVLKELPPITFDKLVIEPGSFDIELDCETSLLKYVLPQDRLQELKDRLQGETRILEDGLSRIDSGRDRLRFVEAMAKSVSTLRMFNGLQKLNPVSELVKAELEAGAYDKIVIFAIHRDVIHGLRKRLSKFHPVTLYGGTPPETRQKNIDKFQSDPKCKIFIGNVNACGTAITLTASCNVLFVEQSWTPADNAQAAMRCHRIGQKQAVFVRTVGIANTIDEKIAAALCRKSRDISAIFDVRTLQNEIRTDTTFASEPITNEE